MYNCQPHCHCPQPLLWPWGLDCRQPGLLCMYYSTCNTRSLCSCYMVVSIRTYSRSDRTSRMLTAWWILRAAYRLCNYLAMSRYAADTRDHTLAELTACDETKLRRPWLLIAYSWLWMDVHFACGAVDTHLVLAAPWTAQCMFLPLSCCLQAYFSSRASVIDFV